MPRAASIAWGLIGAFCFYAAGALCAPAATRACLGVTGGREGDCAPDFTLKTLDGKTLSLSRFRGKVVFLNFWATWCEPCAAEVATMDELNRALRGSPFVMLSVSMDDDGVKSVDPFLRKNLKGQLPSHAVLLDSNQKVSSAYGTFKVPETYVIDKAGRITDKIIGVRDWGDSLLVHYFTLLTKEKP
ncbi:MAG: TlpA disulfide reductase family protein [Pseudomonadota bacterium]